MNQGRPRSKRDRERACQDRHKQKMQKRDEASMRRANKPAAAPGVTYRRVHGVATAIEGGDGEAVVRVGGAGAIRADRVVLATGYAPPLDPPGLDRTALPADRYVRDPWAPGALDRDVAGRDVVVVGSGATAITIVPSVAGEAEHVTMLQRTPTYVLSLIHI